MLLSDLPNEFSMSFSSPGFSLRCFIIFALFCVSRRFVLGTLKCFDGDFLGIGGSFSNAENTVCFELVFLSTLA